MARRKMSMTAWAKALHDHEGTPRYGDFQGNSPGGAGANIGVSRERVHQLVKRGDLDILELYVDDDSKRRPVAWLISDNSQRRLLAGRMKEQGDFLSG